MSAMSDIIITDGKSPVVAAAETTGAPETPVTPDTQNQAAADTGNENEDTVTATKRGRSLSVGGKIGIVVAFCLFALVGVAGVGISQMQKINTKIVGIAERDIPLTEMVTKITVHQLEQALNLERSIRFGEEMKSHPSVRTHFEESVHRFEKLSAKVNSEIRKGEEMAQHDIDTAATEAEKAEFTYVLSALKKIEHEHASFDEHSFEAIKLLKAGNVDAALKLAGGIEKEVEKLDHELVALLDHISKFTLHAAQEAEKLKKFAVKLMMIVSIAGFLIAALCAWLTVTRTVARPLRSVVGVLGELDAGNLDVEIAVRSNDEIGAVAAALGKFRENMRETQRLEAEATEKEKKLAESERKAETERLESEKKAEAAKREAEEKAAAKHRQELIDLAEVFENEVGGVVTEITEASANLKTNATSLQVNANEASSQSAAVAAASEETTTSVQTVASAAEELSASIQEITRQVSESANTARNAVTEAETANDRVLGLEEAARKIGEVVELINDIASQTNLLALNATIEAARAGEAGKGFAVVATEVKSLADQTARATDEIGGQITAIQEATSEAVGAIGSIGDTIRTVDDISSAIAAAVEEQGSSTQEISVNIQQVSAAADEVNTNINAVSQASGETGTAASDVLNSAETLSGQASRLNEAVGEFLNRVRAA